MLGLCVAPAGAVADPTEPPAVRSAWDPRVSATFDRPSYRTGERMSISVTIENAGTEEATVHADFSSSRPDAITVAAPNPFGSDRIAPGASVTRTVTGVMGDPGVTTAKLYAMVSAAADGAVASFQFPVPVEQTTGHVSGIVYFDGNHNGSYDAGEGRSDFALTFTNLLHNATTVTNAAGEFALDLPTGSYSVSGRGAPDLMVVERRLTVDQSGVDDLLLAATLLAAPTVDLKFTKDTYGRDEAPTVRVTLTNPNDVPLHGIYAHCNREGLAFALTGLGEGWGDLVYGTSGVTVAAHSTRILDATEPMPAAAYNYGFVAVSCEFNYEGIVNPYVRDLDTAAVPGKLGDLTGTTADNGTGVGGVKLELVGPDGGCPVAVTTSDAEGNFVFRQVPVGNYQLFIFPPAGWHVENGNPAQPSVVGDQPGRLVVELAPGDAQAPTPPACPAGPGPTTPAPQPRPAPAGLAATGASILVPGVLGLLAVLTGGGAIMLTRKRGPGQKS